MLETKIYHQSFKKSECRKLKFFSLFMSIFNLPVHMPHTLSNYDAKDLEFLQVLIDYNKHELASIPQ